MPATIDDLLRIMADLRDPNGGCPWDLKQDFETIAPYTIEEAYEVSDAIQRGDMEDLREELGDLLLQVVYHAQMAGEAGSFAFDDVVAAICSKMVERHPHVFDRKRDVSEAELRDVWESRKEDERRRKKEDGALDGVALALPALMRAQKLIKRAARKGFHWDSVADALAKCREELDEFRHAADQEEDHGRLEEELGDALFACVGLAAQCRLDAEEALRLANARFEGRFRRVEKALEDQGRDMDAVSAPDLLQLWDRYKTHDG